MSDQIIEKPARNILASIAAGVGCAIPTLCFATTVGIEAFLSLIVVLDAFQVPSDIIPEDRMNPFMIGVLFGVVLLGLISSLAGGLASGIAYYRRSDQKDHFYRVIKSLLAGLGFGLVGAVLGAVFGALMAKMFNSFYTFRYGLGGDERMALFVFSPLTSTVLAYISVIQGSRWYYKNNVKDVELPN